MLTKHTYRVSDRGELVVLAIGNWSCSLEFAIALGLAAMLKREARYAKASAGLAGWHRHGAMGVLRDLNAPKWKQERWRKLPERLARKHIHVHAVGQLVCVKIGAATIEMPWPDTQKLSQALRVHGRLARNVGGETASWAEIASVR